MRYPARDQVALEQCPVADETVWLAHATGFVAAFVTPAKRDRWELFLTQRPDRMRRESSKLHSDLDRRTCRLVTELPSNVRSTGVYYDFFNAPRLVPATVAIAAGTGRDAIFSLTPGVLAVYVFHEYEEWLCESPGPPAGR